MAQNPSFTLYYITCSNIDEAKKIAKELVSEKLAACCNIIPEIHSIYNWEGKLQEDKETLLLAKTSQENFSKLEAKVKSLHSYECPCIIGLSIKEISEAYANWLKQQA